MKEAPERLFTIEELARRAAAALAQAEVGQPSARVRDLPDRRTIRYYTTLGLLDRPKSFRGRTALYGRRHLLQLLAIKRLQSRKLSLEEIQAELLGLPEKALLRIAALPRGAELLATEGEAPAPPNDRRATFWRHLPEETPEATREAPPEEPARVGSELLRGVRLSPGVALILEAP